MSQLAQISPTLGAGPSLRTRTPLGYDATVTRRKHRIRPVSGSDVDWLHTYPPPRHLVENTARPDQVAAMIREVMDQAPSVTFVAFGRTGYRLLGKTERLIEREYDTKLRGMNLRSGRPGRIPWPTVRHEYQLRVQRRTITDPTPST